MGSPHDIRPGVAVSSALSALRGEWVSYQSEGASRRRSDRDRVTSSNCETCGQEIEQRYIVCGCAAAS
ncbi:hypothetical protein GCM10018779_05100 [Streptomyces griseocarneus]|nr:hypothetical protein GCM10018779_05100 [Streptomyces griseocarneus]